MTTQLNTSGVTMGSSTMTVSGNAPSYPARAWVFCDGNGGIYASGNVSSVSHPSGAVFTMNFSTGMSNANYGYKVCVSTGSPGTNDYHQGTPRCYQPSASSFTWACVNGNGSAFIGVNRCMAVVFTNA